MEQRELARLWTYLLEPLERAARNGAGLRAPSGNDAVEFSTPRTPNLFQVGLLVALVSGTLLRNPKLLPARG